MNWDYFQLDSAFSKWAKRANASVHFEECVALAEAEFNRKIRHPWNSDVDYTFAFDDEYNDLPPYFIAVKDIHLNDARRTTVRSMTPGMMASRYGSLSGPPEVYTVFANKIRIAPVPSAPGTTGTLTYYRTIPAIDNSVILTNWLLTAFPDLYLYASLVQLSNLLEDDQRVGKWTAQCDRMYMEVKKHGDEIEHGLGPLIMDVDGPGDNVIGSPMAQ